MLKKFGGLSRCLINTKSAHKFEYGLITAWNLLNRMQACWTAQDKLLVPEPESNVSCWAVW